jgi:hypothetical protein
MIYRLTTLFTTRAAVREGVIPNILHTVDAPPENRLRSRVAVSDHECMFRHAMLLTPASAGALRRAPMSFRTHAAQRLDGVER